MEWSYVYLQKWHIECALQQAHSTRYLLQKLRKVDHEYGREIPIIPQDQYSGIYVKTSTALIRSSHSMM
jgi:hypothetical protein